MLNPCYYPTLAQHGHELIEFEATQHSNADNNMVLLLCSGWIFKKDFLVYINNMSYGVTVFEGKAHSIGIYWIYIHNRNKKYPEDSTLCVRTASSELY